MLQLEQELYGLMEAIEAERKENQTISFDPESDEPQPYNNSQYAYKYNIKVIMVSFNILRIKFLIIL